jgi:hypothetical protein
MHFASGRHYEFQDGAQVLLDLGFVLPPCQCLKLPRNLLNLGLIKNRIAVGVNEAQARKVSRLEGWQEPPDECATVGKFSQDLSLLTLPA